MARLGCLTHISTYKTSTLRTMRIKIITLFLCLGFMREAVGQNVFFGMNSSGEFYLFDQSTCSACLSSYQPTGINPANLIVNGDILLLSNGNFIVTIGDQLLVYDPPQTTPIFTSTGTYFAGSAFGPGNLIYLAGGNTSPTQLYTFNTATNALTLVGPLPAGLLSLSDLFYYNNQLYGVGTGFFVWQINTTNPAASVQLSTSFNTDLGIADNGLFVGDWFGTPALLEFNPVTGNTNFVCPLNSANPNFVSFQQIPPLAPPPGTCVGACTTNAGTLIGAPINICIPGNLTVPYNNNATLDANDALQYVLVTDPANPNTTRIVTTNSPTIAYDAGIITPGVTYYVATVAGNNAGGGTVSTTDPCLDYSNFVPVVWRPRPAVTLSTASGVLCAGSCSTITANFQGTPPFSLTLSDPTGPVNLSFPSNSGDFLYCAPPNTPAGALTVQSVRVQDAFCICE
jgi:hypothetical protein